jgi:hypothetical protein
MSFNRHLIGSLALAAIVAPSLAGAADAKWYDKLSVGGHADAQYELWLNQPAANDNTDNSVSYRAFDNQPNKVVYGGEVTLGYKDDASKTGANIDLLYGYLGIINNLNQYNDNSANTLSIGQAYLTQGVGPVTLTVGKFATPVGYETWNSTANANYSRSIIYQQEPFYSTGIKLDYAAPYGIGAGVWFDNGNSTNYTNNDAKNWGIALSYTGVKDLAVNAQWYEDFTSALNTNSWTQYYNSGTGNWISPSYFEPKQYLDVNIAYTLSPKFSFAIEYLYQTIIDNAGDWEASNWGYTTKNSPKNQGYALYATYNTPVDGLSVNGRFEQFFSPDANYNYTQYDNYSLGYSNNFEISSYTLTVKYAKGPLTHILEYRADASNEYEFQTKGQDAGYGATAVNTDFSQIDQTLTYAAVFSF